MKDVTRETSQTPFAAKGDTLDDLLKELVIYDEIQEDRKQRQKLRRWKWRIAKIHETHFRSRTSI